MKSKINVLNIFIILFLSVIVNSCSKDGSGVQTDASASTGVGGSLARFTIASGHLYMVDHSSIQVYSLANPGKPGFIKSVSVGFGIETIFPYADQLFIGSQVGMFIYSISDAANPRLMGKALHLRACDPVVANDTHAFVTLRGGTPCGTATDGLYIYDIKNTLSPVLIKQVNLPSPAGLGLKESTLYVCLKESGMTVLNVAEPLNPKELMKLQPSGRKFMDVIPYGDLLICYVDNGILLYDISDAAVPKLITNVVNN
jgi:hypothetical protein